MKLIWEPEKVGQIRKAIKKIREQKIMQLAENPFPKDLSDSALKEYKNELIEQTINVKEENVLITGNPKQGLKLKILKNHLKSSFDPNSMKEERITEIPLEEKRHRKLMTEFLTHAERRSKIVAKIEELRNK